MCAPFLRCATMQTYLRNTMKCAHPFFDNNPRVLLRWVQNQYLVPTTHQPICRFTFTIGTNNSPTYMYNYKGIQIRDITCLHIDLLMWLECPFQPPFGYFLCFALYTIELSWVFAHTGPWEGLNPDHSSCDPKMVFLCQEEGVNFYHYNQDD